MMKNLKTLILKFENDNNAVARITLNRPEVRNAFNPEMIQEITETFRTLSLEKAVRLIILDGAGKSFCAGADLEWMKSMVNFTEAENKKDSLLLFEMFESILNCEKPVLTIAHGGAFGGALGILAASDIVLAEESTSFCFSEVKLGLAPAVISCFILRKLPIHQVSPLMLSGRVFTAPEALNIGLAHDSFQSKNLDEKVNFWVKQFLDAAPQAVTATKKLIRDLGQFDWKNQRELACGLIAARRVSPEGQEGLKAFLEKRNPAWRK